jgi:hypothetical protein
MSAAQISRAPQAEVIPPGVFEAIRDRIATGYDRAFFVGNAATEIETVEKWDRHLGGIEFIYQYKSTWTCENAEERSRPRKPGELLNR